MELYPGFVFRFKIFPFLKERILPLYKDVLRRETTTLILSENEEEYLKSFTKLFPNANFEITSQIEIQSANVLFEAIEKYVSILTPFFNKIFVSENEKKDVLEKICSERRPQILHILS